MRNWKYAVVIVALLVSSAGFAKGPGGGGSMGGGGNSSGMTNSNGRSAADRDTGPARAEDRMSAQGKANTNGPNALDRDKGRERAEDRNGKADPKHRKTAKRQAKQQPKRDSD